MHRPDDGNRLTALDVLVRCLIDLGFDTASGREIGSYLGGDDDIEMVATDGRSLWVDYYDSGMVDRYDLPAPKP